MNPGRGGHEPQVIYFFVFKVLAKHMQIRARAARSPKLVLFD